MNRALEFQGVGTEVIGCIRGRNDHAVGGIIEDTRSQRGKGQSVNERLPVVGGVIALSTGLFHIDVALAVGHQLPPGEIGRLELEVV